MSKVEAASAGEPDGAEPIAIADTRQTTTTDDVDSSDDQLYPLEPDPGELEPYPEPESAVDPEPELAHHGTSPYAAGDHELYPLDDDLADDELSDHDLSDDYDLLDGDVPAARPPRRHLGRYLVAIAVALVLGAAIVIGPPVWRVYSARHTTLTLPAEIGNLTRDTGADSQDTADYLRDAVGSDTSLSHPIAAVYDANGDKAHSVLLFGGTGSIFRTGPALTTVFGLLDDSSDAITGLHSVPPGPRGGMMKCGTSVGSDNVGGTDPDMPICGWADHGSVVAALFPGRSVDQAADLMRQFRTAIETQ